MKDSKRKGRIQGSATIWIFKTKVQNNLDRSQGHSIVNESMHVATDTSDIEERQVSDYVICKLQTVG